MRLVFSTLMTYTPVELLGPCFKTGRIVARANATKAKKRKTENSVCVCFVYNFFLLFAARMHAALLRNAPPSLSGKILRPTSRSELVN